MMENPLPSKVLPESVFAFSILGAPAAFFPASERRMFIVADGAAVTAKELGARQPTRMLAKIRYIELAIFVKEDL